MRRATVSRTQWREAAHAIAAAGGRLVALWGADRRWAGAGFAACAAYALRDGLAWLDLALDSDAPSAPDIGAAFPCAVRMQRAMTDLVGIAIEGASDTRPWIDHGLWPAGFRPLRDRSAADARVEATDAHVGATDARVGATDARVGVPDPSDVPAPYDFVRVEGDGVHEIAVGPVHAGIIEPGHFRFSVVGEKVLRLEERLGYTHKGIERRFQELAPLDAHRLAGRVAADTTVAYAWAWCMALESACAARIPPAAQWLRALMLERERVANHLNDLGALGNDAGLAFGLAQFSRLREQWLRLSMDVYGHRFMMDRVVPGGVQVRPDAVALGRIRAQCDAIEREVGALRAIYDEHAGLQDRFIGAGRATPELAAQLGLTGLAGRASGQAADLRCDQPWSPYDGLEVSMSTSREGDVAARVAVRFDETFESLRLIRALCEGLPPGPERAPMQLPTRAAVGVGRVEGWRGEVFVALELGADARIRRCHCHDPSWQNWPVVEHATIGNIVPDFPLINKSFNLCYSGHDL